MTNAEDFRSSLNVSARNASVFGATRAQIDYIVSLHDNQFNQRDIPSKLTKKQASAWIDRLINPVEIPSYVAPTPEEVAAKEEADRAAKKAQAELEVRRSAWIAENYPDYEDRSTKARKRIRHAANKAMKN